MANNFGDGVTVQRTGTAEWKVYDNGVLVGTHTKRVTAHAQATGLSATGSHSQRYPGTAKAEVQVITLTSFTGTDSFTVTVNEGGLATTTAAFVRGTNAAASDLQTALRTATGDAGLLVTGDTDEGPFTVTFIETTAQPELTVTGTGCTGAVTVTTRGGGGPAS